MSELTPSTQSGKRSYWKRPEGKVGMGILAGVGALTLGRDPVGAVKGGGRR